MEENALDPWIQCFKMILDAPPPPEMQETTEETDEIAERDKHIFWKLKGIVAKATYFLFIKYNDPEMVEDEKEK